LKILFLESFFAGSHKDFALGYQQHSSHEVELITLPARFWKWRMRGSALAFFEKINNIADYDAVFATDMINLGDFRSLCKEKALPTLLYFHENQLTYPLSPNEKKDFHLGMTNVISALCADKVVFNSHFHLNEFQKEAKILLNRMPDCRTPWVNDEIAAKTSVIYPGCHFAKGDANLLKRDLQKPLIIWNHRWEHDKNPDVFFDALRFLKEKQIPFSLAVLGERYHMIPDVFHTIEDEFKEELVVFGYVESKKEYQMWLKKGAVVVSTAIQENFGISVVEAVRFGCIPLLPRRLSYPEIMPGDFHSQVLYDTKEDLFAKLAQLISNYSDHASLKKNLSHCMEKYSWDFMAEEFDNALKSL